MLRFLGERVDSCLGIIRPVNQLEVFDKVEPHGLVIKAVLKGLIESGPAVNG